MKREEVIEQVFENLNTLKRLMFGRLPGQDQLPISPAQLELLITIHHLQPVNFKTLAQQLHLTPGAISQLADFLATAQLVTREGEPTDRRIQRLSVSKKGEKLLHEVAKRRRASMEHIVQALSTEELATWLDIQRKLIDEYKTNLDNQKR